MGEVTKCPHKDRKAYAKGMCKSCYEKLKYHESPERYKTYIRRWQRKHPEKMRERNKKWRASHKLRYRKSVVKSMIKGIIKKDKSFYDELKEFLKKLKEELIEKEEI